MKNDQLLSITERLLPYATDFPEPVRELLCEFVLTGEVPETDSDLFYDLRVMLRHAGHGDSRSSDSDNQLPTRYQLGVWILFSFEERDNSHDQYLAQLAAKLEQQQPL